jgi:Druantia protein DruA
MSECLKKPIMISPQVGRCRAQLVAFCEQIKDVFQGCNQQPAQVRELRRQACSYIDRPTLDQLKLMLVSNLMLDLALHGWSIDDDCSVLSLIPPDRQTASPLLQKDQIRKKHLIERDAQLREPSVRQFIQGMERRRLTIKGWHSIYSVVRDGEELATALGRAATYDDPDERARQLERVVDPYLQFVTPDGICPETGLRLNDIWRYFRHTWVNAYRSVPGRSLMVLVRDRSTPYHPVVGIAALASSVIQQSIRDKWIGWDSDTALAAITANPTRKIVTCLLEQLRSFLKGIYIADLVRDGLLTQDDLKMPSPDLIRNLRAEAAKRIKLHQRNPEATAHKSSKARTRTDWTSLAETNLYRSKRCKQLASILEVQQVVREAKLESLPRKELQRVLQQSKVKHAVRRIVRLGKAERVGIGMMDIMVCGAVAPYNAILGGKLVCLLLCSPEVVRAYADRYSDHVSVIASGMKGAMVKRKPTLVLLCTTSLYGNGSSQYNRVKLPAKAVGGDTTDCLRYEELGTSEGFGSFHFSKESLRIADALLGRSKQGRKVNSIFGEGVNPLMRKMREALTLVALPSDLLLNHGNKRIVYGVPLARNFRSLLLGFEKKPRYFVPQSRPRARTSMIAGYWRQRWLSRRVEDANILEQVAQHSLAYPIRHGAQVELPGEEEVEMLKAKAASVSSFAGAVVRS